jgi:hypothetical protein
MIHINSEEGKEVAEISGSLKDILVEILTVAQMVAMQVDVTPADVIKMAAEIWEKDGDAIQEAFLENVGEIRRYG